MYPGLRREFLIRKNSARGRRDSDTEMCPVTMVRQDISFEASMWVLFQVAPSGSRIASLWMWIGEANDNRKQDHFS
jgi:hypothetical protein